MGTQSFIAAPPIGDIEALRDLSRRFVDRARDADLVLEHERTGKRFVFRLNRDVGRDALRLSS